MPRAPATATPSSGLDLAGVRRFCENPLRDALLQVPGVADVEVFGGEQRLVAVALDRDRLVAHDPSVTDAARALAQDNVAERVDSSRAGGLRVWSMLLAGKHGCMPSFMGLILLMGVVVKNGILLVDFFREALARRTERDAAILEAVRLRTRPILMTAGSTIVGMLPIALEWAVGIERLSPLAVVAVGGLVTGTFLTLFVVPVLLSLVPVRGTT